ncbi:MAG: hypothetical protein LBT05_02020 [Planctomycetaceae bacterium]|jgi:superfamily II DNA or RNA helicase|nr:hypothetical protein [Planctomycetaceae bacterium]
MQNSLQPDDTTVPKIRLHPPQVLEEDWKNFVVGQFPQFNSATHRLAPVDSLESPEESGRLLDVVPLSQDAENPLTTHRVLIRGTYDENHFGECRCDCDAFHYGIYGVCSHILFALSQKNHGTFSAQEQSFSEIFLRRGLRNEIIFRAARDIPRIVSKAAKRCFHSDGTFRLNDYPHLKTLIQRAAECRCELKIENDVFEHLAAALQQRERSQKIAALFKRGAQPQKFETLLAQPLATYQRNAALQAASSGRFLLFDSSGFGKRRTIIAAAEILAETSGISRVLILTNTTALQTWRLELQQSLPQNRQSPQAAQIIFGAPAKRVEQYGANTFYNIARYDDMKTDADAIVSRMRPDLIILDETHTLKRHGAEIARMARRLESEFLFILSGADPSKIPGALTSFVDMIDRRRFGMLETFLQRRQQFDPMKNQVRYVNMRDIEKTLPRHFRRLESAEYRRSLPALILHERYLPLDETQAKRHADLQNQWFRLVAFWKNAVAESRKPETVTSTPQEQTPVNENAAPPQSEPVKSAVKTTQPILVPFPTLQKIQSLTKEALCIANGTCKIETMYDLLLEHLETPRVKAIVFAHDLRLLRLAKKKLERLPFDCGLIDRFMNLSEQKTIYENFLRGDDFRVLFLNDGVSDRLTFRQTQLVIELDFPQDFKSVSARRSRLLPHETFRPCHIYPLISYGTMEHWFVKLYRKNDSFTADHFPERLSVTLMNEQERLRYFDRIVALSEQSGEPPMVLQDS